MRHIHTTQREGKKEPYDAFPSKWGLGRADGALILCSKTK